MIDATLLPPLFAPWIGRLLAGEIPPESHATCDRCAMCARPGDVPRPNSQYFDPEIKCCTYLPPLPNFLVGRVLADGRDDIAHGRSSVDARLTAGVEVTPLGLGIPAPYSLLYDNARDAFGRARGLRCPHYVTEGGKCGIWRHREAICATWFCKRERGATADAFWSALRDLLREVERDLARWCVWTMLHDPRALAALFAGGGPEKAVNSFTIDGRDDVERRRVLWGEWFGREREFFRESAGLVDPLQWEDVLQLCGPGVRLHAGITQAAYRELVDYTIPVKLRLGRHEVVRTTAQSATIQTYSPFDPLELPRPILDALPLFEGRTTEDAFQAIADRGLLLTHDQLRQLIDFRMLLPVEEASSSSRQSM